MRFASLGSGSRGNALLVESGRTRILLDCGFGPIETQSRLARLGVEADTLDAILVTHEHDDHAGGVAQLAALFDIPVHLTWGTLAAMGEAGDAIPRRMVIDPHTPFAIGDIEVRPYAVPHDAREPSQFVLGDGAVSLGVLTDAGRPTPHIVQMLSGVAALVLECNHDSDMLVKGPYHARLKRRIAGSHGHLANAASAEIVRAMDRSRLQHVIAAHLSQQNNTPELARAALSRALDCAPDWVGVATQDEGFDWREIVP